MVRIKKVKRPNRYPDELKRKIAQEYLSGRFSYAIAANQYRINPRINRIQQGYDPATAIKRHPFYMVLSVMIQQPTPVLGDKKYITIGNQGIQQRKPLRRKFR
jgi:hypothetical protein